MVALCALAPMTAPALALSPPGNGNGIIQITWGTNGSQVFNYTGAVQQFVVPAGVSSLRVQAIGANGGNAGGVNGGIGASVSGTIAVTPNRTLYVYVGGRGQDGFEACPAASGDVGATGGFNGGGGSFDHYIGWPPGFMTGGGGGGASDVQEISNQGDNGATDHWLIGAAGGGGAGGPGENNCAPDSPGGGGGPAGANGFDGNGPAGKHYGGFFGYGGGIQPCGVCSSGGGGGGGHQGGSVGGTTSTSVGGDGGNAGGDDTQYTGGLGGGGGGGYYGGGGGGGGGGSDGTGYMDVAGDGGGGGGGGGASYIPSSPQQISGQITTPFGDGLAGATVQLSGSESQTATTDQTGNYIFNVDPGTYTVTPSPASSAGSDEYTATSCPGTAVAKPQAACQNIAIAANQSAAANFTAAFTLTGTVSAVDGSGVAGATISLTEVDQSGLTKLITATTNAQGQIAASAGAASLGLELAPGTALVSAVGPDGTQYYPVPSGGTNPDCVPANLNCRVTLDRDRNIAFSPCLVPNPDGSPLPAGTPDPIPGAVIKQPLEAVGCWIPQNGTATTATIFTSKQPIRLDGIDVNPGSGTTFTLDTSGPTVTSNGPAQVFADGYPLTRMVPITFTYQNGVNPAGAGLSIGDLGAGTGPLGFSLFGLPISLGTGGPFGYGLPFVESTGQTVVNLGAQFTLPFFTRGEWDTLEGKFKAIDGSDVPSIGLGGQLTFSDRNGLVGQPCASINDLEPFDGVVGKLAALQGCWTPARNPTQWTVSGMWETPSAIQRLAGDIYATVTFQNAASAATGQLQGYQVQAVQVQFDHLNSKSFNLTGTVPGGSAATASEVKASGIPVGGGVYLQSLGGGFKNNLATGKVSSLNGTAGFSIGPELDVAGEAVNLIRIDGKVEIQPPQNTGKPGDDWVYQLAGAGTLGRLTPWEFQLGNASVTYLDDATTPIASFLFHIGRTSIPVIGGLSLDVRGSSDTPPAGTYSQAGHGVAFEGTTTLKVGSFVGTNDVLLNASFVPLNPFQILPSNYPPARLADCFTTTAAGKAVSMGFTIDFVSLSPQLGCNMSGFFHPLILPQATGSRVSADTADLHRVRVRLSKALPMTVFIFQGAKDAPRFRLSGPGFSAITPRADRPEFTRRGWFFIDRASRRTYVALPGAAAGTYSVTTLPGSSAIARVFESNPLPSARVTRVRVARAGCSDSLAYRLSPAAGERVLVYAREGSFTENLGYLSRRSGRIRLPMLPGLKGRGTLIAYFMRGSTPVGIQTLGTFANAGANGSERLSGLRLNGTTLSWGATCGASSYAVKIAHGATTTNISTIAARVTLPTAKRPFTVTVTALSFQDRNLARGNRRFAR